MRLDLAWIEAADALVCVARSPGVDREVEHARQHGVPVYVGVAAFLAGRSG